MKRFLLRMLITIAVVAAWVIGLVELSKWCARKSADKFLGPAMTNQLPYMASYLSMWGFRTTKEGKVGPRWVVRYGGAFMDPGLEVEVFIYGNVTACNVLELNRLIELPENERMKEWETFISSRVSP